MFEALKHAVLSVLCAGETIHAEEQGIGHPRCSCPGRALIRSITITALCVSVVIPSPPALAALVHKAIDVVTSVVPDQALIPDKLESGSEARANAAKLISELHWFRSLPEAEAEAARQNKLVFWMHMLGDIDGKT